VGASVGTEVPHSKTTAPARRRSLAVRHTAAVSTHNPPVEGNAVAAARASGQ
jgi:hypothetical protein